MQLSSTGGGVTVNPLQSSAAATISGDDMAVTVLALDVDRGEGADGATIPFTFRVLRAGPDSEAITVSYSITGAVNADDFLTPLTGTINLAAGVSEGLFTLQVKGDAVREGDEAFNVTFSHPAITSGTTILAGNVRDDDEVPADDPAGEDQPPLGSGTVRIPLRGLPVLRVKDLMHPASPCISPAPPACPQARARPSSRRTGMSIRPACARRLPPGHCDSGDKE